MSIESVFPTTTLTDGEILDVLSHLTAPTVVKYLKSMTMEDSKELLSLSALDMSDKELANRHIFVSGKLSVLTTLLSLRSSS